MIRTKRFAARAVVAAGAAAVLALSACSSSGGSSGGSTGSSGSSGSGAKASGDPIKIGVIVSKTGNFAPQAKDEVNGIMAALNQLTGGTMVAGGHKLEITTGDDTGQPSVGTSVAKQMIGDGAKILIGPTDSAVALAVAQLAVQNHVLFIGGTSGTFGLVGMDKLVFGPSGSSPAGIELDKALIGSNPKGKTIATVDQDYAYGQASQQALKALLTPLGVTVKGYLLPQTTTDFSAVALQIKKLHPDFLTTTWAGAGQNQLWSTLGAQGLTESTTTFTYLLLRSSWPAIADALGSKVSTAVFTLPYYGGMTGNAADKALQAYSAAHGHQIEYDDAVGYNGGAMIYHAVTAGGTDTDKMASALQGYDFEGPSGTVTIRAADNQVTVPSATVHLVKDSSGAYQPKLIKIYTAAELNPPVVTPLKK